MAEDKRILEDRLTAARKKIDEVDLRIVKLLAERFGVVDEITDVKALLGLPAVIPERIEVVVSRVEKLAVAEGVPQHIAEQLWRLLIDETIKYENQKLGH